MARKLGFSFLYFAPRVGTEHLQWFDRAKHHGYDGVELPINEASADELSAMRTAARDAGLETTAVGFCTDAANPLSDSAANRAAAVDHLRTLVDRAVQLDAKLVAGPIHSAYGVWSGEPPTAEEFDRSVEVLRQAGDHARQAGVTLAVEPLNRFESYFLTTASQCNELIAAVANPNVVAALDTHHAHIEETGIGDAIRASRATLGHVQLSENHRGTPGTGQVDFDEVARSLDDIGYDSWLVIEAFSRQTADFGSLLHVWRTLDDGPEAVLRAGAAIGGAR